jgi:hypothetical protein
LPDSSAPENKNRSKAARLSQLRRLYCFFGFMQGDVPMGDRRTTVVVLTTALLLTLLTPAAAQSQLPRPSQLPPPGGQMQPPQRAEQAPPPQQAQQAAKPYKPVSVIAPAPVSDPSFDAFRKQLAAVAQRKDRRALAGMVVAQGFFWIGEKGDRADKRRSGIDNLARAIGLDAQEGHGWETLAAYAADPSGRPDPDRKDTVCAPGGPSFNEQEFEALLKATGTDDGDWGYPMQGGLEMRAAPHPNSPVVEKLGMHLVRVMEDDDAGNQPTPMLRIVAPSGKVGFVPADAISPLTSDEICYRKDAGGWKITGFIGGEQ